MKKTAFKTQVRYFKRWTRKGYAAFSSMQKVVVISTISLACSFLAKPTGVFAQSNQDSVVTILEEVQVMADDPLQTETMQLMLLETAVMQCDIERSPVQALNELLDQLPNLDIRQRGPFGIQADISYRGGNFDQTLLLLNGINFTDPQTGHYTLNLPISPDIIQRIELYKNTTAFLFGTAPFSGLLNIITRCDTTPHFDFHFMGGMYGLYRVNADMNVRTGKFSHLVSMEYGHADGYMENTDFNTVNAYYQTIGRFKAGILELQAGFSDKKYGANGFYSLKFPNQYESTQTFLASVKWKGGEKVKWIPSIYYRFNKDCFELVKGQSPTKNNWHFNQIFGLNILSYFDSKIGRTSLSGDVRVEDVVSTSLGNLLDEPIPTKVPNVQYLYGRTRTNFGLSASQSFVLGGFTGDLTLLLQHFTDIRNKYYLLPAVHVGYRFRPQSSQGNYLMETIYCSGSGTIRNPTFTDLYYKTGDILGNQNLLPERAYTVEAGAQFKVLRQNRTEPYFVMNVAIFNRWGLDMIDFVKQDGDEIWHSINHTNISFTGVETGAQFIPTKLFTEDCYVRYLSVQYTYLYSDKQSDGWQSRYVLDHLIHRLSVQLTHKIYKGLELNYSFSFNQRKGEYTSYKENPKGVLKNYPNYCLLDLRLQYNYRMFTVYVEASNILNVEYFDLGDLVQPGIWARGGVRIRM